MKYRFKGHETFFFREGWLSKAMYYLHADVNTKLFYETNGIAKLGVGANMVKAIKYWLTVCGLLEYDKSTREYKLTELGQLIANNDLYFEDTFSLWLLHINLVRNVESATTWYMFFNQFHAKMFMPKDVKNVMVNYLEQNDAVFSEKSLIDDINVLLKMYTKEASSADPEENYSCPLERLKLIKANRDGYSKEVPNLDAIHELTVLYAIKLIAGKNNYVNISDLESGENSLSNVFNFNRIIINEYLEQLQSQGYIRIEKTAGLDMVYLITDLSKEEIVKTYYEGGANL